MIWKKSLNSLLKQKGLQQDFKAKEVKEQVQGYQLRICHL
jgi:hypothetical protein